MRVGVNCKTKLQFAIVNARCRESLQDFLPDEEENVGFLFLFDYS